jgi:hypothetical protein
MFESANPKGRRLFSEQPIPKKIKAISSTVFVSHGSLGSSFL